MSKPTNPRAKINPRAARDPFANKEAYDSADREIGFHWDVIGGDNSKLYQAHSAAQESYLNGCDAFYSFGPADEMERLRLSYGAEYRDAIKCRDVELLEYIKLNIAQGALMDVAEEMADLLNAYVAELKANT